MARITLSAARRRLRFCADEIACYHAKLMTSEWAEPQFVGRCGRCLGEPATFGKRGPARKHGITRQEAHVKLGCVVKGY